MFQVSRLFCEAYLKAATPTNAINGFRKCGICPIDSDVFTEVDFIVAETTNQPEVDDSQATARPPTEPILINNTDVFITPAANNAVDEASTLQNAAGSLNSSLKVPPSEVHPLPQLLGPRQTTSRRSGSSAILTSSPYKNELTEVIHAKEAKEAKKKRVSEEKKNKKTKKTHQGTKKGKKRSCTEGSTSEDSIENVVQSKPKLAKTGQKNKPPNTRTSGRKKLRPKSVDSSSEGQDENAQCFLCGEMFSKSAPGEGWIRCSRCPRWAHDACAGIDGSTIQFTCETCSTKRVVKRSEK